MIRELAEYKRHIYLLTIREEDLVRDRFGEKPRFRALIAEWDGHPAGYKIMHLTQAKSYTYRPLDEPCRSPEFR